MAPKYHPTPLSGGDRKALAKELDKARAMAEPPVTRDSSRARYFNFCFSAGASTTEASVVSTRKVNVSWK